MVDWNEYSVYAVVCKTNSTVTCSRNCRQISSLLFDLAYLVILRNTITNKLVVKKNRFGPINNIVTKEEAEDLIKTVSYERL